MWFDLAIKQKIDFANLVAPNPETYGMDIDQSLSGDSCGWGFNAAFHFVLDVQDPARRGRSRHRSDCPDAARGLGRFRSRELAEGRTANALGEPL